MASNLISIVFQYRKIEHAPDWRFETNLIVFEKQYTIKVVCMSPAQCKATMILGAVIVPIPPQLQRTGEAELKLPIEYRTGQCVHWITH